LVISQKKTQYNRSANKSKIRARFPENWPGTFHLLWPELGVVAVAATRIRSGVTACRVVIYVGAE
jgi:hypothetical protein